MNEKNDLLNTEITNKYKFDNADLNILNKIFLFELNNLKNNVAKEAFKPERLKLILTLEPYT